MNPGIGHKAKIMLIDDHPMVREGMAALINREADMTVCCTTDQIEQALSANRACPHDLAIVDLTLDGFSGMEMMRRLQFEFPALAILILSMHAESIYAEPALKAGARGYLMKQTATDELLQAIRTILQGERYISPQMQQRFMKRNKGLGSNDSAISSLTASELEVLQLIGIGLGTNEIADRISRSVKTIDSHKANIKKKLNLENSKQLTMLAINFVSFGNI
jgi:DNA-binding NarL/FixJ family response regulator